MMIEKLKKFIGHEVSEDEVYIFDVILCDNDIDRDIEAFSDNALDSMQKLFIGKIEIFDHNAKVRKQFSRIFDTQVVLDDTRTTKFGKPYKYLKGNAYMAKTSSNEDLIKEIDGGIKKEVSVSCNAKSHRCSICGADKYEKGCNHVQGKYYGGKLCYTILDDIVNAYEWSFVTVPAQVKDKANINVNNVSKKSYIDYYVSREITGLSAKCIKSLLELRRFLHNIDDSKFDEWDKCELHSDKIKVARMIKELHENFGEDDRKDQKS